MVWHVVLFWFFAAQFAFTNALGNRSTSKVLTHRFDSRGSTVALADANGNVTDRLEYSVYGLVTYRAGGTDTPFLYNGRYGVMTDANGLLYMRARYYNPHLCRFINADPAGFSGGLNWYAFANGNPVSNLDPFGLGAMGELGGGSWINQIASGLGFDNSLAAQIGRQDALVSFVNFATLGLANDAASVGSGIASRLMGGSGLGYDLYGNVTTRQEQMVSAVMLGLALIPGEDVEAAGARAATEVGEAAANATVRTFTSSDPLVANLANKIESLYPGHVVGVNVPLRDAAGNLLTDADLLLQNSVLQVKSGGSAQGLLRQLQRSEAATGLPSIGFGPNLPANSLRTLSQQGALVTADENLLLQVVKP